jgi:predicted TIM-barrel fold metal-dependent hydrolase
MTADGPAVVRRARSCQIQTTIASPLEGLMPRGAADAVAANTEAHSVCSRTDGLKQWCILHPFQIETFAQVDRQLSSPHCLGIKLHPEEHRYPIRHEGANLFACAARHNAVVLVHSGDAFSAPLDFIRWADEYPNVTLILAHLGNGGSAAGDPRLQVQAIQASRHGNVFVDTSSARSILPGLLEWAVAEIGPERILFGTDTPLYFAGMQRARVDYADLSEPDKIRILNGNARRIWTDDQLDWIAVD